MTNLEALVGELEPFSANPLTMEKAMTDNSIDGSETYSVAKKHQISICSVKILCQMLVLSSESTGHSSQSYSKEGIEERIIAICADNGLVVDDYISKPYVEVRPFSF